MDDKNPIADWDQEEDGIYLCPVAGWQTGNDPSVGVAVRVTYFRSPDEIRRDAPSAVQLVLPAQHAMELGEELMRQGRAALGQAGQSH